MINLISINFVLTKFSPEIKKQWKTFRSLFHILLHLISENFQKPDEFALDTILTNCLSQIERINSDFFFFFQQKKILIQF